MKRVLDVVDWAIISKGDPEAWLYFYERFLDVYDRRLRKLTGSYYTPPQVVQAMVRLCDEALKAPGRFAVHDGIASPQVHIADPATGSGTFLLALIRRIAEAIEADQGKGAVRAGIEAAAQRLYGFELQFGAFAVAQLRLLAEMLSLGAEGSPHLFVTDTLADPYEHEETGTGLSRQLSRSRIAANKVKTSQPITLVIGNPPYKEKAMGRGGWVEEGSAFRKAPLKDWQPPKEWKVGAHSKHLRNLYVYFWRWAAWKVFEQGSGGRDKEPPEPEKLSGLICYITVAGFLNGPGFQKMRHDLRRDCDEIWIIDCSPEGHQPEVATRIFEGVQQPICIVIASRSPANDAGVPARVRYRSLELGLREQKFDKLAELGLGGDGWRDGPTQWRAPFLPEFTGGWADLVPLEDILGDGGSGVMPGRTWIISPDRQSLEQRWAALIGEKDSARRAVKFHPHEGGDRTAAKGSKAFSGHHEALASIEYGLGNRASKDTDVAQKAATALRLTKPVAYGFRSFDRQWIIPDYRLINRPNPGLWEGYTEKHQVYLTALSRTAPRNGPAATVTAIIPDLDHYRGSFGGRVFPLWKDAAAHEANVSDAVIAALTLRHGSSPDPLDIFAYVAALLASPAYTERFRSDLVRPGLRLPITADKSLFDEAAALGRKVVWLHSFGERFADPANGRPSAPPRLPPERRPYVPEDGAIPADPAHMPDTIDYDPVQQRLKLGSGFIDNVQAAVWSYEVSGKQVLRQWFSYRKRNRERPQIGDKRPPSPLQAIQADRWLPEYTAELLNVLNILGLLVELEPEQADLLRSVVDGPLITPSMLA
jgi:predicted helicase